MSLISTFPEAKTEVAKRCINRLHTLSGNEFDIETAYELLSDECFSEIMPKDEPIPPSEYFKWEGHSLQEKDKLLDKKSNFKNSVEWEIIMKYVNDRAHIFAHNNSHIYWLNWCKKIIPDADIVAHEKINERLRLFERGERKHTRWSQREQVTEISEREHSR